MRVTCRIKSCGVGTYVVVQRRLNRRGTLAQTVMGHGVGDVVALEVKLDNTRSVRIPRFDKVNGGRRRQKQRRGRKYRRSMHVACAVSFFFSAVYAGCREMDVLMSWLLVLGVGAWRFSDVYSQEILIHRGEREDNALFIRLYKTTRTRCSSWRMLARESNAD